MVVAYGVYWAWPSLKAGCFSSLGFLHYARSTNGIMNFEYLGCIDCVKWLCLEIGTIGSSSTPSIFQNTDPVCLYANTYKVSSTHIRPIP